MGNLSCPECDSIIIKSYGEECKLRSKLVKWNSEGIFAVCKSCGHDVAVHSEMLKSFQNTFTFEAEKSFKGSIRKWVQDSKPSPKSKKRKLYSKTKASSAGVRG